MSEVGPSRRGRWLRNALPWLALLSVLSAFGFVWLEHSELVSEQRNLHLIDTQPRVFATFYRYDPGSSEAPARAWAEFPGKFKEFSELWGAARLQPGQPIEVVVDPDSPLFVVPVYAREYLAGQLKLYPRLLDDTEMYEYQFTMPLTWIAGVGFGTLMIALLGFREWFSGVLSARSTTPGPDSSRPSRTPADAVAGPTGRRNVRLGVAVLVLAALVVFLSVAGADQVNAWGMATVLVSLPSLLVFGGNLLLQHPRPALSRAASTGLLVGLIILIGWSQARPSDLVGSRLPTPESVRIAGLTAAALLAGTAGWITLRHLRRRPSERVPTTTLPARRAQFATARLGYDTTDVDALLEQLAGLPDSPQARAEARDLIRATRFRLQKHSGYEPVQVDQYLDTLLETYNTTPSPATGPAPTPTAKAAPTR